MLIGASHYDNPALSNLPAVANNLDGLTRLLLGRDTGTFSGEHFQKITDPSNRRHIGDAVANASRDATDVLLVYYAGHGLLDSRGRLHLALAGSNPDQVGWTALPFDILREELADSPAATRILILDCCFSARAFETMSDPRTVLAGQTEIAGTYTIVSSAANEPSYAPSGHGYTAFTEVLIEAATNTAGHSLDELYREIDSDLFRRSRPRPHRRSVDRAGELVLFNKSIHPDHDGNISVDCTGRITLPEIHHARNLGHKTYFAEAEAWWRRRADDGDALAMHRLAEVLDLRAFRVEAVLWYERAAASGNPQAMYALGEISELDERPQEARLWYDRALQKGYLRARDALARIKHA
ncbi:caspase, EACC1-associated type [Nocardia takedensis]|uniref:caspase, EACC1-associated type n=1 Tax=Nocardia takedensis TaxID=259390 RepID=UPI003F75BDB4